MGKNNKTQGGKNCGRKTRNSPRHRLEVRRELIINGRPTVLGSQSLAEGASVKINQVVDLVPHPVRTGGLRAARGINSGRTLLAPIRPSVRPLPGSVGHARTDGGRITCPLVRSIVVLYPVRRPSECPKGTSSVSSAFGTVMRTTLLCRLRPSVAIAVAPFRTTRQ